jgi:lysozyme family protein
MVDIAQLKDNNARRWAMARATRDYARTASLLVERIAKAHYLEVAKRTGVPWFFIAVVHQRESSQNFARSLAQGDPWDEVSVHVPVGRGPFHSWEEAAVDALVNCPPFAAANVDWSTGGFLTMLEKYNGLGYASRGLPSPYVWSGTDQYIKGKFVRDGVFDPNVVDQQPGCAALLMAMAKLDSSVNLGAPIPVKPAPAPTPAPAPAAPPQSIWSRIAALLAGLFRRK